MTNRFKIGQTVRVYNYDIHFNNCVGIVSDFLDDCYTVDFGDFKLYDLYEHELVLEEDDLK